MFAWAVLWIGGCADSNTPASEPSGRSELVILTPADSASTPADVSPAGDAKDATDASDTSAVSPVFFDPEGEFTMQVGVFRDAKRAGQQVRQLKDEGYPAYSLPSDAGVRVRIGYFANRADADRFGRIFAQDRGVEYWIARRANE